MTDCESAHHSLARRDIGGAVVEIAGNSKANALAFGKRDADRLSLLVGLSVRVVSA